MVSQHLYPLAHLITISPSVPFSAFGSTYWHVGDRSWLVKIIDDELHSCMADLRTLHSEVCPSVVLRLVRNSEVTQFHLHPLDRFRGRNTSSRACPEAEYPTGSGVTHIDDFRGGMTRGSFAAGMSCRRQA